MSKDRDYPAKYSRVIVTLIDGVVKEYNITAGGGLLPYLMQQAGSTGALVLLCGDMTHAIPMNQIAEVVMHEFDSPQARDAAYKGAAA